MNYGLAIASSLISIFFWSLVPDTNDADKPKVKVIAALYTIWPIVFWLLAFGVLR